MTRYHCDNINQNGPVASALTQEIGRTIFFFEKGLHACWIIFIYFLWALISWKDKEDNILHLSRLEVVPYGWIGLGPFIDFTLLNLQKTFEDGEFPFSCWSTYFPELCATLKKRKAAICRFSNGRVKGLKLKGVCYTLAVMISFWPIQKLLCLAAENLLTQYN